MRKLINLERAANPLHNKWMSMGCVLRTVSTLRWSAKEIDAGNEVENKMLFVDFTEEDEGRGRILIAKTESKEYSERIEACWNVCNGVSTNELRKMITVSDSKPLIRLKEQCHEHEEHIDELYDQITDLNIWSSKYQWTGLSVFTALCVGIVAGVLLMAFK